MASWTPEPKRKTPGFTPPKLTEGGIHAAIFDYVDKALEDPDTLQRATGISYWFPCTWEAAREIRISKEHLLFFFMQGPDGSFDKWHIRIVDTSKKNGVEETRLSWDVNS
jgi:hypothetical protein